MGRRFAGLRRRGAGCGGLTADLAFRYPPIKYKAVITFEERIGFGGDFQVRLAATNQNRLASEPTKQFVNQGSCVTDRIPLHRLPMQWGFGAKECCWIFPHGLR
jgi:hypothetical protein